jgi:hypothetical protein
VETRILIRLGAQAGDDCACYAAADAAMATAEAPQNPVVPGPLLEGPSTAAVCEGLALSAAASTGAGGRAFADISWQAAVGVEKVQDTELGRRFLGRVVIDRRSAVPTARP